jgi:tetratricopeptide (TPR) repeat protein
MTKDKTPYDLATIRKLLLAAFSAKDLLRFCQDRPIFRPIVDRFGLGTGLDDMVAAVIDYCETQWLFRELLDAVKQYNPQQYARFEEHLQHPQSGSQEKQREQQLATLYANGQEHHKVGHLHEALGCFRQVQEMQGDYQDVNTVIATLERAIWVKRLKWASTGLLGLLVVISLIVAGLRLLPNGENRLATVGPTISTGMTPTTTLWSQPMPSVSATSTTLPTPTPLVPLPVTVSLQGKSCETQDLTRVGQDIENTGGEIVTGADVQMRITMLCSGAQPVVEVHFPERPAYRIEFLDEPTVLSVAAEMAYARAFVGAATAYAGGDYAQAASLLEQINDYLGDADAYFLYAQALMHLERWPDARTTYTVVLNDGLETETTQRARTHAGLGLAYILEVNDHSDDEEVLKKCIEHAWASYEQAISLQPDRALWWLGHALARLDCSEEDATDYVRADVEKALTLCENDGSVEEALALSMMAKLSLYWDGNPILAIEKAQQAIDIAPELPLPYQLLSDAFIDQEDLACSHYRAYVARIVLPWRRQKALQHLDKMNCQ